MPILGVKYKFNVSDLSGRYAKEWKKIPNNKEPVESGYVIEKPEAYKINIIKKPGIARQTIAAAKQHCKTLTDASGSSAIMEPLGCNNFQVCILPPDAGCVGCAKGERKVQITYYHADPPLTSDEPLEKAPHCITYYKKI